MLLHRPLRRLFYTFVFRIFPNSMSSCSVVAWLKIELQCEKKYCNCACKMFASGFASGCVARPKNSCTVRRTIVARKCLLLHLLLLVFRETEVHRIAMWGENLYVCFCIFCFLCCSTEELWEKIYLQRCCVFWTINIHVQWTSLSKLRIQSVTSSCSCSSPWDGQSKITHIQLWVRGLSIPECGYCSSRMFVAHHEPHQFIKVMRPMLNNRTWDASHLETE